MVIKLFIILTMVVTGYCDATGASPFEGMTASGVYTNRFTTACPPEMEFGTVIIMDGKIFICEDRGGAIKGNRLDIWFPTCDDAILWGRQEKEVLILGARGK